MAITLASKFSPKVDERFALASLTQSAVNNEYEFVGVNAVNVYSIPTVALNNYTATGANRYGTPSELQNTVQTLTMTQDKSFTFTIDRKSEDDTAGAMEAGKALRREIDEVVIPTIDKYRLAAMVTNAGKTTVAPLGNAYDQFLEGQNELLENGVPMTERVAFVAPKMYKALKLDPAFIKGGDVAQNMLVTGSVGMVDGVNIVPVPASYLPADVLFILTHKSATCAPVKLEEYKLHTDAPGISGTLVEGRIRHDAFVLTSKAGAVYAHKEK